MVYYMYRKDIEVIPLNHIPCWETNAESAWQPQTGGCLRKNPFLLSWLFTCRHKRLLLSGWFAFCNSGRHSFHGRHNDPYLRRSLCPFGIWRKLPNHNSDRSTALPESILGCFPVRVAAFFSKHHEYAFPAAIIRKGSFHVWRLLRLSKPPA